MNTPIKVRIADLLVENGLISMHSYALILRAKWGLMDGGVVFAAGSDAHIIRVEGQTRIVVNGVPAPLPLPEHARVLKTPTLLHQTYFIVNSDEIAGKLDEITERRDSLKKSKRYREIASSPIKSLSSHGYADLEDDA